MCFWHSEVVRPLLDAREMGHSIPKRSAVLKWSVAIATGNLTAPLTSVGLAPRAHGVRIFIQLLLHRLEHVLVLPAHGAALRAWRAAAFERAIPAGIGPVAVQLLPVFLACKTVCQFLAGRTAIDIFLGQIDEILLIGGRRTTRTPRPAGELELCRRLGLSR
jgi:hypothetical protein